MFKAFPEGFQWGVGSSSFQIEGGWNVDGKGPSIWDHYTKQMNLTAGNQGCKHYERYKEDVELLNLIGVRSYRFSISWPRLFPNGIAEDVNEKGMHFYKQLIELLFSHGITPMITIFHWDLPMKLQEKGGYLNDEFPEWFARYARSVFRLFPEVKYWLTINEPHIIAHCGYSYGTMPPFVKDLKVGFKVAHNLLLAHGRAVQELRDIAKGGKIGIVLDLDLARAVSPKAEDIEATERYNGFRNWWFLNPILSGAYPETVLRYFHKVLPDFGADDFKIIGETTDFLGVNHYFTSMIKSDPISLIGARPVDFSFIPKTEMNWPIDGSGLYDLLIRLNDVWKVPEIYITENGGAFRDDRDSGGMIADDDRILYLRDYLSEIHRAIGSGVKVKGYYLWSFLDSVEWLDEFSKRFGIIACQPPGYERILKKSAYWYQHCIRGNGFF